MSYGPCLNPNCKSHGQPHPNCGCYGYADGGIVEHYCSQSQPHQPDCEYFAEGGTVSDFISDAEFKPDQPIAATGFIPDNEFQPDNDLEAQANAFEAKDAAHKERFGGLGNQIATVLGSAAKTVEPGANHDETMTMNGKPIRLSPTPTINPEHLKDLQEENPVSSAVGTIAGLMIPGGQGSALEKMGAAAADRFVPEVVGEGVLRGMKRSAVKLATENAVYQSGDEISKMLVNDPNQSVSSAIANIGLAGAIGGVAGGALGSVNPLWKATLGTKAEGLVSDFKARMREHLEIPEVVPEAVPETKPGYDPFTKSETAVNVTPHEAPKGPKYDPFTKQYAETVVEAKPLAQTAGGKLADSFIKHSDNLTGKVLAGSVGGAIGHATGIPYGGTIGAILGEKVLSPLFESVLPAITKPIIEKMVSGEGLKAAIEYSTAVAKGYNLSSNAVTNLFKSGSKVLPDSKRPDEASRKKLQTNLDRLRIDPSSLVNSMSKQGDSGQNIGHYMPNHAMAIGTVTQNVTSFLNSLKPQSTIKAPLDTPKPIPRMIQAQYDRALDIAEQPLSVLESIKDNTITSHDVLAMQQMYPDLYRGLKQRVMEAIVSNVSKETEIPYNLKLGLSIFMGQPLDSTMQPEAIAAAQPIPEQQPAQGPEGKPKKLSQGAGSQLVKGSKSLQTQVQASEAMHASGAKA